jgi:Zn ribbon nucleic-acid-binding protein
MNDSLYNVSFITDSVIVTTSIIATDEDDAIASASYVIEGELGVAVSDVNCRVEVTLAQCAHEGTMGSINLDTEMVTCDECGYSESADPDDIANHIALRDTGIGIY